MSVSKAVLKVVEDSQIRTDLPAFRVGYTIRVNYRIVEGDKERIQGFEGVVIRKHFGDQNATATFTVRKETQGHGVERNFPMQSPRIESIKVIRIGDVRRSKLYYLRTRFGKAARIREKIRVSART